MVLQKYHVYCLFRYGSMLCFKSFSVRSSHHEMRPLAASLTLNVPAAISLTVAKIFEKSSKVTNGTFSFSQYVTKSRPNGQHRVAFL